VFKTEKNMKTILRSFLLQKIVFTSLTILLLLIFGSIILAVEANDNVTVEKEVDKSPNNKTLVNESPGAITGKTEIDKSKQQPKIKKQPLIDEIRGLIVKLGDDNFVVRERASKRLLQIGKIAEPELQRAVNHNDVEISLQATAILDQLELLWQGSDNIELVEEIVKIYSNETDQTIRLSCVWHLASPLPDAFKDGEGLKAICRIVRFDKDKIMRNEAAKCLIALSPFALSKREKWYKNILRVFSTSDHDMTFKLIHDFISLRVEIDKLRRQTESEIEARAQKSGEAVDYPVKLPLTKNLEGRLNEFVSDLNTFQNDPLYSKIKPGHWVDILVFYAVAELYDEIGKYEERDKIIETIMSIREAQSQHKPVMVLSLLDDKKMNEHFRTAIILQNKQRLNWSERHLKLVIDDGYLLLKVEACQAASMVRNFMADWSGAIEYLEKCSEIVKTEEYIASFNNSKEQVAKNENQILAYQAQLAADNGDWNKAKELVDKTLAANPTEIDTIILRYKICENDPKINQIYRTQMKSYIDRATSNIRQTIEKQTQNGLGIRPYVACNQVAWLLANTNGEFSLAKDLIEITIKNEPDSATYLDTQAHVFALGKQYNKAIEIQTKAVKLSPETKLYRNALERFKKLKSQSE
jgi:tetratricopeptide (TPR) repeat protein